MKGEMTLRKERFFTTWS